MRRYFGKVECKERNPHEVEKYYITNRGLVYFDKSLNWSFNIEWWLEPVEEPLYTKSDMLSCWDAALSHALKLKGYYKTFAGFIKSLKN